MSTVDTTQLVRRSIELPDLVTTLTAQHDAKLDLVVPAAGVHSIAGVWEIDGTGHATLGPDGVTSQVCSNGYTVTRDAMREVHLGGQLGEGVIHWSAGTQRGAIDLIAK